MASNMTTKDFFAKGTPKQFEFALSHYDKALRLKAESKSSKPENVIKLDKWYQTELPKKIKSRGKDAHLVHDELVQTIKWKLARGKFRPNLVNLVQMNTPRVVQQETKKAFRKLQKTNDLQSAANALCNLKGVGPGLASAVLAAGAPHIAPFMADECLLAMPDVDSLDYTMKEYMRFVEYVKACVERLNAYTGGSEWTPHRVELAVWTHYICRDLKPDILVDMPEANESAPAAAAESAPANGVEEEDSNTNFSAASTVSSACDEDSNSVSEANKNPEEPSAEEATNESEVVEAKNGNKDEEEATPKTNGNNSHSNGSEANAKEQNGDDDKTEAEAKVSEQTQKPNGELENGVKSSEESTDLSSSTPSAEKRSHDDSEVVEAASEPAAKKLKSCEEESSAATPEAEAAAAPQPAATPNATPQVAV